MEVYIDIDIRVDLEACNHKIKDQEIIKICQKNVSHHG